MAREVKMCHKHTREGPDFRISLYDERGRWVLTSRVYVLDDIVAGAIAGWLEQGFLTFFATCVIKRAGDTDADTNRPRVDA